jgi:hypothetical protein
MVDGGTLFVPPFFNQKVFDPWAPVTGVIQSGVAGSIL